jgi:SAM-dependent methyltransferase
MPVQSTCPSCAHDQITVFYRVKKQPVNSVLIFDTREEALAYPCGEIALGFCLACGFVFNTLFDPALTRYSQKYEATQSYSPTFSAFARNLAQRLIDQYDLRNKTVIEIGCGQGEFLIDLCELGPNRGIGFDPAYIEGRVDLPANADITFIADFYSEQYSHYHGDLVACKMTLEHIPDTGAFIRMIRNAIGDRPETVVFFQVPNALHVFQTLSFWDVYYEHSSYFSPGALARLFRRCGLDVIRLATVYDGQYLNLEARPGTGNGTPPLEGEIDLPAIAEAVQHFAARVPEKLAAWRQVIDDLRAKGKRVIMWGGSSKTVSFLTTFDITNEIDYVVDINPHKDHTYLPGTGHLVVTPDYLHDHTPDVALVANPIYVPEIAADLARRGLSMELIPVA